MSTRQRRELWPSFVDVALVALVLVVGLAGSLGAYRSLSLKAAAQEREQLNAMGQSVVGAFDRQLMRVVEALQAAGQMLSAQTDLTREQFMRYGASLVGDASGLTLLEWQPVVPHEQLAAFERQAAREQPGYLVVEPAPDDRGGGFVAARPREFHVPVHYSWPESGAAVGVDMAFDPRRMHSKLLARDTGVPIASEVFTVIHRGQPGGARSGFAVSAPVYRVPRPVGTEARRRELRGFLAGVVELPSLMSEALVRAEANGLDVFVFDQEEDHRLIYASASGEPSRVDERGMALSVDVGGRPWQLVLRPRPGALGNAVDRTPLLALAAGGLATLLVALAVGRSLVVRRHLERTETVLAEDRQHLSNVIDGTAAGTWDWRLDSDRLAINERWAQMLGYTCAELEPISGQTWERLCHPGDLVEARQALDRHLGGQEERYAAEFRMRHAQGHWVWVQSSGRVFERDADDRPLRLAGTHLDISRRKADEQRLLNDARALEAANRQLRDLAILDALTGAFNRRHFDDICLASAQRGQAVGLCMLDIDHFKAYNDRYGHQAGDAVLRAFAQTLNNGLKRSTDALFRLGGEEFGVIFSASSAAVARQFVGRLSAAVHALAVPHADSPHRIVTASFGVAWWAAPTSGLTPEAMYAAADEALYEAKRAGRDQIVAHCFLAGEGEALPAGPQA
ncbi:diguanylate cyclase domain-containing protein [Roseateles sp.]|uniref:sensor domain-containing diguanylate cyclase n=1 Tax=Roseateles sp. TaxID=1971397 RepID=UPI0039ED86ED